MSRHRCHSAPARAAPTDRNRRTVSATDTPCCPTTFTAQGSEQTLVRRRMSMSPRMPGRFSTFPVSREQHSTVWLNRIVAEQPNVIAGKPVTLPLVRHTLMCAQGIQCVSRQNIRRHSATHFFVGRAPELPGWLRTLPSRRSIPEAGDSLPYSARRDFRPRSKGQAP